MKILTSDQIRKIWIDFFVKNKHHKENSFSLIPKYDSSLLWINAGITPLKKYFSGIEKVSFRKIVNIQKCLRTNDIDNIGNTAIHHTFFEMMGNFSIGDYFKKEAIDFAYELLVSKKWFSIPLEKLYITYFIDDQETYFLWLKKGVNKKNLIPLKTNFWNIGEGPCGPCTEIFFDRGSKYDHREHELIYEGITNNRFIEIWNIVFSQYNCTNSYIQKDYKELPNKNIDTGAGLERLSCIFQKTDTNFETDLFFPIIRQISLLSNCKYEGQKTFKIIADHIKALVFCINDGAIFSNLGRGYVLKRILRRAFQNGKKIGFTEPFLFKLVASVINTMKNAYSELQEKEKLIKEIIQEEEKKFLFHLQNSEKMFFKLVKNNELSGENFFKLYDTFGFPKEDILEFSENNNIKTDLIGFEFFLKKQRDLSRNLIKENKNNFSLKENFLFSNWEFKSEFIGYDQFETKTKVLKVCEKGIILKKTPFYAMMGGQTSDEGTINGIFVQKVIKLSNGIFVHKVEEKNIFYEGQEVFAKIDIQKRLKKSINHTATHLLLESLKIILGKHVQQQGSFIDNEILRFDFNHYKILSFEELIQIEDQINLWINKNYSVLIKKVLFKDLKKINNNIINNENFFKNKDFYNQEFVRIVSISNISSQLCGGTHVSNTKKIQKFAIVNYKIIGSGIHRIEASTGENIKDILIQKIESFYLEKKQILKKIQKIKDFVLEKNNFIFYENIEFDDNLSDSVPNSYRYIQNYKSNLIILRKKLVKLEKEFLKIKNKEILEQVSKLIPSQIEKEMLIFIKKKDFDNHMLKTVLEYLFNKLSINFLCLCQKREKKLFFICKSKTINIEKFMKKIKNDFNVKGGGNLNFCQGIIEDCTKINEFLSFWRNFL
ncbi:alanine--tRNA ligase [Candidatus Phytoplasma oryzae]|uniref:Alanine--tRNA ligase n=1 Tax=Candidatus Phytoplasma oryzae TaxID=203274 RepID=A0A139JQS3_9MOLU|nr:alanine--tRNA ligase [Candidatus Phytoplasma oryzae]KXT29323.1 alanine--tRNA ligase [Candidatus Phytoplasma oryzae]RAM57878.1 alanyl-tRNA synthetase [Candidatus Phytoplasma oryzae]